MTIAVTPDGRSLTASKDGKAVWQVQLIGNPQAGAPVVRALSVQDKKVLATYGKNTQATIDILTGKLLSVTSD